MLTVGEVASRPLTLETGSLNPKLLCLHRVTPSLNSLANVKWNQAGSPVHEVMSMEYPAHSQVCD